MFEIKNSVLIVIDVQGKLAYLMHEKDKLFKNIQGLIRAMQYLNIPILYTEQVPEKIGSTVPEIHHLLSQQKPIVKTSFSCCQEEKFIKSLQALKRKQIIVCGIETHVCVYQTVSDLLDLKYPVQVVHNAVSSRSQENKEIALKRIESIGAAPTSTEMILTELLRTSKHPKFRDVLSLIR